LVLLIFFFGPGLSAIILDIINIFYYIQQIFPIGS